MSPTSGLRRTRRASNWREARSIMAAMRARVRAVAGCIASRWRRRRHAHRPPGRYGEWWMPGGINPLQLDGAVDVSPDGSHILYYSPGPTVNRTTIARTERRDAALSRAQRWLESRAALRRSAACAFTAPRFSPDGTKEGVGDRDGADVAPVRHAWRHPGDVWWDCHGVARHLRSRRLAQRWRGGDVGGTGSVGTVYAGDRTPDPDAW